MAKRKAGSGAESQHGGGGSHTGDRGQVGAGANSGAGNSKKKPNRGTKKAA